MKKFLFFFLSLTVLVSYSVPFLFSQETGQIVITNIKKVDTGKKQEVEITINDAIKIKEIEVTKIANRTVVKYPVYVSSAGRAYPQVKILTKQANDAIIEAIEKGVVVKTKDVPEPQFEITKFSPNRRTTSSRKVFAAVSFNKAIEIECGIMEGVSKKTGKPYKFVSWPSRLDSATGEWVSQVILKKSFRQKVDDALLKRYDTFKKEGGGTGSEEEWE